MSAASGPALAVEEFQARWERVRELLAERDLDLVVVYGDDHAVFGPAQVRYLADFPVHFEPALVIVPREGEPTLATGPETVAHAELVCPLAEVTALSDFCVPGIEYPGLKARSLAEVVEASLEGRRPRRAAVVGLDQMAVHTWEKLRPALQGAELVELDTELLALRGRKSQAELDVLRHAFRITEAGLNAALAACRPGAREYEVVAAAEHAMRSRGAEGTAIDTIVASGVENSRPIIGRTGEREIGQDETVSITIASRYRGYSGPMGRLIAVGEPPAHALQAARVAHEAEELAIAALVPGATAEAVDAAAREHLLEQGYVRAYGTAHSVGVQEFEAPFLMPGGDHVLVPGNVMSIDIGLFDGPWGGFRMEDAFILGQDGAEPTTDVPRGLLRAPAQ